ncbi:MAG TPA: hypothetical protein VIS95_02775 [Solirubrobacterales bacterium]
MIERLILEIAAELHPRHLTADELSRRIVTDPDDDREVETAAQAIRGLAECGLFRDRDKRLEPTPAALRAFELLA